MPHRFLSISKWLSAGAALALPVALPGCDNPACIFGGDCDGGGPGGAVGSLPATVPVDGEWIASGAPEIDLVLPDDNAADLGTPIVFVFSESMAPEGLASAFELRPLIGLPTPLSNVALVGNGRVLVAFPAAPLSANTPYEIRFAQNALISDRTGQDLEVPTNRVAGEFRTAASAPTAPKVLTTFPADGATGQSATGEIVVVFTRPMQTSSIDEDSFDVKVDGVDPTPDSAPTQGQLENGSNDSRVWIYQSILLGEPVPLGAPSAEVEITLSPSGDPIRDSTQAANALATTDFGFTLAPFEPPTSIAIMSLPDDAIGIDQISGPANLAIDVGLSGTAAGDTLEVFLFGFEPESLPEEPRLIALEREVSITSSAVTIPLAASDLDLVRTSSPLAARFDDGEMFIAVQVRRGSISSPVTVLDVDVDVEGVQGPIIDTTAPTLLGLSATGSVVSSFVSDQRDLVLVGRASETLRAARVTTTASESNVLPGGADPPPVAGSAIGGLFVAAPVPVGVLPQAETRSYSITLFDRALNSSGTATGTFTQVGAIVLGNPLPGSSEIAVRVYDATTLAPIAGARVITHENIGNTVTAVPGGEVATDPTGFALVPVSTNPLSQTILTVDAIASNYDLFTFDGVPTDEISIPLTPTVFADANLGGDVTSQADGLEIFTLGVNDSRATESGAPLFPVDSCGGDGISVACPFSGVPIVPRAIGALSAIAFDEPATEFFYSHLTFFKGFGLTLPTTPASPGALSTAVVDIPALLDGASVDPEELAIDVPAQEFSSASFPFDPGDDRPRIRIESVAPGVPGAVTIGRGVAFPLAPDSWRIRAAIPGIADGVQDVPEDDIGRLVADRTIDPDAFLRIEVVDDLGNVGVSRLRFSSLAFAPIPLEPLVPPATIGVILNVGNVSFNVALVDTLPDSTGMPGLYRLTLEDSAGRRWTLFRPDPPDGVGGTVRFHVPYIGAGNTFPLASGPVTAQAAVLAWSTFDIANFLWSDIGREEELSTTAAEMTFVPPVPP